MSEPIRGKVARVLNDNEIVMNKGVADGVTDGMQFDIFETTQIKDPDTSKVLGELEQSIISLRVFQVEEHFSILYSLDKPIILGDKGPFTRYLLSSSKAFVKIGDEVVQSTEKK